MSQSKKKSFVESIVNTMVGMLTTFVCSPVIYYVCDVKMSFPQMGLATALFTVLSILRNYFIRRWFNKN